MTLDLYLNYFVFYNYFYKLKKNQMIYFRF